jgi:hypothetical protein
VIEEKLKLLTSAADLVVEKDSIACKHIITFTIIFDDPIAGMV